MKKSIEQIRKEKAVALENITKLAQQFSDDFKFQLEASGNTLTVGIGRKEGEITNEPNICAYLENSKLKNILPTEYQGVQVVIRIIGAIRPL